LQTSRQRLARGHALDDAGVLGRIIQLNNGNFFVTGIDQSDRLGAQLGMMADRSL